MSHRLSPLRTLVLATCCALPLLPLGAARAQSLADPAWEELLESDRYAELEAQARQKLKAEPGDPQATLALGFAVLSQGTPAQQDAGVPVAEACVKAHPESGVCHYVLANLLGVQALRAGMFKAMGMAGRIRESYEKAVALQPDAFNHRLGLMQFYLAAPSIAGGGTDKARDLARSTEAKYPEQARCLRALVAVSEEKYDEAEKLLWAVQPGKDNALRSAVYGSLGQIGAQRLNNKQPAPAQALFERLVQVEPGRAFAFYGLARVKAETGALQDALRFFTQARSLRGQATLPIDYREALVWLQLGDNGKAKSLLQRFVDVGRGHPKNLEDAKERLAKL
ncbi:hypothetical protein AACH06_00490 [Ideonella sp. DXS29W]|uniref:Tetratricopeptide repeat protein n=1 Tax=Ideonella lacteola TaxID=2984193 RepID=A0ABU9BHT9_9BURK